MNFLAHSYLSFNQPEILVGNMISDFVKGKAKFEFEQGIQNGIALHRAIDTYTDDHPATREARVYLKPAVGTYAGAFIDVVYDHFLANDSNEFDAVQLKAHTQYTYKVLQNFLPVLPPKFSQMLPFMIQDDWLFNYASRWGTEKSFGGVARRAKYLDSATAVFILFEEHYEQLRKCYNAFFPDVKAYAYQQLQLLEK